MKVTEVTAELGRLWKELPEDQKKQVSAGQVQHICWVIIPGEDGHAWLGRAQVGMEG